MNEKLLHFIWKNRYFNQIDLCTVKGEIIKVIDTGILNVDQGPDFLMGRIMISDEEWIGNIELHVNTSDWNIHGHTYDRNYDNVILHVVWNNDLVDFSIPVLEMIHFVPSFLLERYSIWMLNAHTIPCSNDFSILKNHASESWIDYLLMARILKKSKQILINVSQSQNDWEEVFWHELAKAFGYRVNAISFEMIAKSIPWKIILRHRNSIHQLEALLMGQANLLNPDFKDKYAIMLFKEYNFLKKKYGLQKIWSPVYFLRMRPRNFPTIRLAQLCSILAKKGQIFSKIINEDRLTELKEILDIQANDYWNDHFRFENISNFCEKRLGSQMIDNIIINVFLPFVIAYHEFHGNTNLIYEKLNWLKSIAAEKNFKILCFSALGMRPTNAWESQALLELKTEFCEKRNCLECYFGKKLLGKSK